MGKSAELAGALGLPIDRVATSGLVRRGLAALIDGLLFSPLVAAAYLPAALKPGPPDFIYTGEGVNLWPVFLADALGFAYSVLMLGRYGWTVGMRALKVRVVTAEASPIDYRRAAVRTLAFYLPGVVPTALTCLGWPAAAGLLTTVWVAGQLWMIVDPRHQAYHDKIACTFVVRGLAGKPVEEQPPSAQRQVVTLPSGRLLRAGKWALFVALPLLLLTPHLVEIGDRRTEGQVEAILAQLKAEGAPTSAAQLSPPPVREEENAAPLYQQVSEKLQLTKTERAALGKVTNNWLGGMPLAYKMTPEDLAELAAPSKESAQEEAKGAARETGRGESRLVAVEDLPRVKAQPGEPSDAEAISAVRKMLARRGQVLGWLHKAAAMGKCRFDYDWSQSLFTGSPRTGLLRPSAQMLALEAMLLCEQGDTDAALRVAADIMRISDSLRDTPSVMGFLMRATVARVGVQTIERVLYDTTPSPSVCRSAEAILSGVEFRTGAVRAFQDQRAEKLDLFETLRKAPDSAGLMAALKSDTPPPGTWPPKELPARRPYGSPVRWWFANDELFFLRGYGLQIRDVATPWYQRDAGVSAQLRELDRTLGHPSWRRPVSSLLMVVFKAMSGRVADDEAAVGLARIALLLKIYCAECGNYPESLEELQRYFERELPLDPCSGQPFHYRLQGRGFVLYSVGQNDVDDGGKVLMTAGEERPIPSFISPSGGDLVWVCEK